MSTYVAMLRGINVGGQKRVPMDQLRAISSDIGLRSVETYVQSGNVMFQSDRENVASLSKRIGEAISRSFGFDVLVIVRTLKELGAVVSGNPFLKQSSVDVLKLHVTFLTAPPQKDSLKGLDALSTGSDRFRAGVCELYLHRPDGYGRTKFSNNAIEKVLAVGATTRNWTTTSTLFEMASKL